MAIVDLNRYSKTYPLIRLKPRFAATGGEITGTNCCDQIDGMQNDILELDNRLSNVENAMHFGLFAQDNDDVIYPEIINHAINTGPFFLELNTIPTEQLLPYNIDINFDEQHLFFNNSKKDIVFGNGKYHYSDRHWQIDYSTFDITFMGIFPDDLY